MVNAPWYIGIQAIHRDLDIPMAAEEIKRFAEEINKLL